MRRGDLVWEKFETRQKYVRYIYEILKKIYRRRPNKKIYGKGVKEGDGRSRNRLGEKKKYCKTLHVPYLEVARFHAYKFEIREMSMS